MSYNLIGDECVVYSEVFLDHNVHKLCYFKSLGWNS
jgi:hypothetical protein